MVPLCVVLGSLLFSLPHALEAGADPEAACRASGTDSTCSSQNEDATLLTLSLHRQTGQQPGPLKAADGGLLLEVDDAKLDSKSTDRAALPEVKDLFTFGAPGTGNPSAWNTLRTGPNQSYCFPGLRFYKEGWHSGRKYADFAAALCCFLFHARQNVVVLGPEGSPNPTYWEGKDGYTGGSMYETCDASNNYYGMDGWPNPGKAFDNFHFHNWYAQTLREQILNHWNDNTWYSDKGGRDRDQFIRAFPGAEIAGGVMNNVHTNGMTNEDVGKILDRIEKDINQVTWLPASDKFFNFKLVGALEVSSKIGHQQDKDLVILVQQHGSEAPGGFKDNDCILTFEGTDVTVSNEFLVSIDSRSEEFCGEKRHHGFVWELRTIIRDAKWKPQIQDKLGSCRSVTVSGFSLGGALAEIFTFCAHRGEDANSFQSSDFQNLMWASGPPGKTGERLKVLTGGDGKGQGK